MYTHPFLIPTTSQHRPKIQAAWLLSVKLISWTEGGGGKSDNINTFNTILHVPVVPTGTTFCSPGEKDGCRASQPCIRKKEQQVVDISACPDEAVLCQPVMPHLRS